MSLGFSKSKQQSDSQSTSSQIGINSSSSFGTTGSDSTSTSAGQSSSEQNVFLADLLKEVYGGAAGAAAGVDTGGVSAASKQLFSGGLGFLDQLNNNPGAAALAGRVGGDTTARDAQLETLKTQLGDLFNEKLAPGITSRGVASGTLGGSRDAVELAAASKAVAGQFATGASSIISSDQAARDAAAGKLADTTVAGAGTGLSALQSLLGIQQGGANAGLQPYQILSSIIGGPTVLGSSQSSQLSEALSSSFGEQGSTSYGFTSGTAQSTGHGEGSSFALQGGVGGGLTHTV